MILAFDLGTSGAKVCIFKDDGTLLSKTFKPYPTTYPRKGFHVQNPEDWWNAVVEGTLELTAKDVRLRRSIKAIAISGQSLTVIPLDASGRLLFNDIPIWSDIRPVEQTKRFFQSVDMNRWYLETGNGFAPECYSLFKLMWYRDTYPDVFQRIEIVLGSKDYLNYRLTGNYATDYSYASGSGAYSLLQRTYVDAYLNAAEIPRRLLPEPVISSECIGRLSTEAAKALQLSTDVAVCCGGVDNACMAVGSRSTREGRHYMSLGSSAWIAVSSNKPLVDSQIKPFVFDHVIPDMYTSATSIFSAGNSLRWFRDTMAGGLTEQARKMGVDAYELIDKEAMKSGIGAGGVLFNPTLSGVPASSDYGNVTGAFLNLRLDSSFSDLARSVMEGVAFELFCMYRKLEKLCAFSDSLILVGGGSKSAFWRQMFADVFNVRVSRLNTDQDAAALGAAAIAAVGSGLWDGYDHMDSLVKEIEIVEPIHENVEAYALRFTAYCATLEVLSEIGNTIAGNPPTDGDACVIG